MADRVRFAGLRALFGLPSRPVETKTLAERVRASSTTYLTPGQPYSPPETVADAIREGYEGNPLVYRAIEVICQNAIAQPVTLRRGDPEEGPVVGLEQDPTRLLYTFNRRANPWETALIFRHRMTAQYVASLRGVFIEVILSGSGRVGMVNLLDPDLVEMVPSTTDPIGGFRVRTPNSAEGYNYLPRFDPDKPQPASILWIRSPHPTVMWRATSPMHAAALSIDLDHYARLYNRRFLQNDGRPGGLLSVKGVVDRDVLERIQAQFTGGPESAGRTTVIQADAVSYADTSGSPRDLMWGELSNFTRKDIALAFGVPESVLGDASGRTFDNADAEYEMFWQHRMRPLLRMLDDQLDILTGGYDDDLYLRHDLSKVWVLGRHKREAAKVAREEVAAGLRTINEYRDVAELDKFPGPIGDVLLVPSGKIVGTDDQEIAEEVAALPMLGTPPPPPEPPPGEVPPGAPGEVIDGEIVDDPAADGAGPDKAGKLRQVARQGRAPAALTQGKALVDADAVYGLRFPGQEGKQGGAHPPADVWR